ncbi:MAG: hypothetical protein NTU53_12380 [Planctomycetota bacterium]|nr:hypothetical protein [Planctomycetota bacterium]
MTPSINLPQRFLGYEGAADYCDAGMAANRRVSRLIFQSCRQAASAAGAVAGQPAAVGDVYACQMAGQLLGPRETLRGLGRPYDRCPEPRAGLNSKNKALAYRNAKAYPGRTLF